MGWINEAAWAGLEIRMHGVAQSMIFGIEGGSRSETYRQTQSPCSELEVFRYFYTILLLVKRLFVVQLSRQFVPLSKIEISASPSVALTMQNNNNQDNLARDHPDFSQSYHPDMGFDSAEGGYVFFFLN